VWTRRRWAWAGGAWKGGACVGCRSRVCGACRGVVGKERGCSKHHEISSVTKLDKGSYLLYQLR
jgi:hypothetical protein